MQALQRYAIEIVIISWAIFTAVFGETVTAIWLFALAAAMLIQAKALRKRYFE